jgi:hypothetical protein
MCCCYAGGYVEVFVSGYVRLSPRVPISLHSETALGGWIMLNVQEVLYGFRFRIQGKPEPSQFFRMAFWIGFTINTLVIETWLRSRAKNAQRSNSPEAGASQSPRR